MLKKRVLTSIIALPVLVASVWFDDLVDSLPLFTIAIGIAAILSFLEFSRLLRHSRTRLFILYGILVSLVLLALRDAGIQTAVAGLLAIDRVPFILAAFLLLPLFASVLLIRRRAKNSFNRMSGIWTVIGIVYIGWMLGHFIAMRGFEDGRNWVLFTLFITFAYDTAAFFTGRRFGRHKMAPRISPGKTWEGAAGGLAGALLISLFFTLSTSLGLPIPWYHALIMAGLISVFGQAGDLLESAFKRYTGNKDSGKALPGHGGFLDRIDSLVFAGLVVYWYVTWILL